MVRAIGVAPTKVVFLKRRDSSRDERSELWQTGREKTKGKEKRKGPYAIEHMWRNKIRENGKEKPRDN